MKCSWVRILINFYYTKRKVEICRHYHICNEWHHFNWSIRSETLKNNKNYGKNSTKTILRICNGKNIVICCCFVWIEYHTSWSCSLICLYAVVCGFIDSFRFLCCWLEIESICIDKVKCDGQKKSQRFLFSEKLFNY